MTRQGRNKGGIEPSRLKRILRGLLDIYSPSGKEEGVLDYLWGYCRRRGLPAVRHPVENDRYNLLLIPPNVELKGALVGHLDTVAAHDLERLGFQQQEDKIFGLGAADMKGGCAAMIEAFVVAWQEMGPRLNMGVFLVVGEEEDGDGARSLVESYYVPFAIIGEPTDLRPCLGQYGYVEVQVICSGRRAHASLASQVPSPVEEMMNTMLRLTRHIRVKRPDVVLNVRDLFSGPTGFVVPDRCEAWIDIHMPPRLNPSELVSEIRDTVMAGDRPSEISTVVRFPTVHGGYELGEDGELTQALRMIYAELGLDWSPHFFQSHSDANVLWDAGIQTILLGPGSLKEAHTAGEWISFTQVKKAAQIYLTLMRAIASGCEGMSESPS